MAILLFGILVAFVLTSVSASVVNTTVGQVQGTELAESGIETFLGIPYAEAPEGDLRFKPPVRKSRMDGVYKAVNNEYICPQPADLVTSTGSVNMTEDCLRLDIYKPMIASTVNQLPVMIWIHGGAYVVGDSKTYYPVPLAAQNGVIVVVINYRLGALGFLDTLDQNSIGNFGLRDQCSAIEWVSENIEQFGGNSSSVTIFGESAGSGSVTQLALSSLCHGKFHRIIAQSGSAWAPWSHNKDPLKIARDLATKAGCPTVIGPMVTCLKEKPFEKLIEHQTSQMLDRSLGSWSPSYSGDVFPENPIEIKDAAISEALRRFRSLDLLIGLMNEEGELFINFELTGQIVGVVTNLSTAIVSDKAMEERIRNNLKFLINLDEDVIEKLLPSLKFQYTDWMQQDDSFGNTRMAVRLEGDLLFVVDIIQAARHHARSMTSPQGDSEPANTFFYQFVHKGSWVPVYPWSDGGTHGEDIAYIFGHTSLTYNGTTEEENLSRTMMEYWTNFAKTGNPNSPSRSFINTTWPPFDTDVERFLKFDVNMSPDSTSQFPYARRVAFWEQLVPAQIKSIEDFKKEMKAMKEKQKEKCKQTNESSAISGVRPYIYLMALLLYCFL